MERENHPDDVRIELYLTNRGSFSSELVRYYLEKVEKAVYRASLAELTFLQRNSPAEFGPLFDAVRYRAEPYRSRTFNIDKVASGSLLLSGVAAGVTLWIFDRTFGESFKEAWKRTDHHARLVELMSSQLRWRAQAIADNISERREPLLGPSVEDRESEPSGARDDVTTRVLDQGGQFVVRAEISANEGQFPPVSALLDRESDRRQ